MIGTRVEFWKKGLRYEGIVQAGGPDPPGTTVLVGITVKPKGGRIGIIEVATKKLKIKKET